MDVRLKSFYERTCRKNNMSKDIGNKCVECLEDTSFGSGKFVDRIPADNGVYDGYMCENCQMVDCDKCKNKSVDYFICNKTNKVLCEDCVY